MIQSSSRRKRRPPKRLSWPATLSQYSSKSTDSAKEAEEKVKQEKSWSQQELNVASLNGANIYARKRGRQSNSNTQNTYTENNYDGNDSSMWVERFAPKSSSDLCIAPQKLKQIKFWIQNSLSTAKAADYQKQKLLVLVGSPGTGKSTAVRTIAMELKASILSWNESFNQQTSLDMHQKGLFSVEHGSALNSFNEFLQQSGSGISSLNITSSASTNNGDAVILLEALPNLHGVSAESRFRTIMSYHLQRSHVPTILVFSDVSEGKHRPEDLERLITPDVLYDNEQTTIMQIHPVTKPKMKKILTAIAKQEKLQFSPNFFEDIHHQSNGDIRHAIMTLQVQATGKTKTDCATATLRKEGQNNRDTKLSTFHSLGKLLYAKRIVDMNGDSRLAFDPERILERSDLGIEGSLRFLEFHSVDFFTDITEISNAYSSFSDAVDMLGSFLAPGTRRDSMNGSESILPRDCASAIAGRTVANTNIHPAPNKFRQFSRPRVFDVIRNSKQNQLLINQLFRRLSKSTRDNSSMSSFVAEALPFVRQINPREVDPYLENLYSVAMQNRKEKLTLGNIEDEQINVFEKEQQTLLEMDDINEFDSD